jgi:hypothetical protein
MEIHRASSATWGDEAGARICQLVIESNRGLIQSAMENKTDLLDIYSIEQLSEPDDNGIKLQYSVIHFDQPELIRYLYKRGMDFSKPCDPMGFGTPIFYAVTLNKLDIVEVLWKLGISLTDPCDKFKRTPIYHARKLENERMVHLIEKLSTRRARATAFLTKNILRYRAVLGYKKMKRSIIIIQRVIRGFLGRRRAKKIRKEKKKQRKEERKAKKEKTVERSLKKKGKMAASPSLLDQR